MARKLPPEISVTVGALDEHGLAGAEVLGKRVAVKGAVPGERVSARVVGRRRGRFLALVQNPPATTPGRVQPACRYFPKCGGCATQHLDYRRGLAHKVAVVVHKLVEQGLQPPVATPVTAGRLGYRRRARLGVRRFDGEVLIGFRESFGNRIVRMKTCLTLHPRLAKLIEPLQALVTGLSIPEAIPQIELTMGDTSVGVVVRHLEALAEDDWVALHRFQAAHEITLFTQSGGDDSVQRVSDVHPLDQFPDRLPGGGVFKYRNDVYGVCFEFGVNDFIQVNQRQNERLVVAALLALELGPEDRLLDLFCGIGNFSLPAARLGAAVSGVEVSHTAVERACSNAAKNGLGHRAAFYTSDLYAANPTLAGRLEYNKVLLDPPRSGAGPQIATWLSPEVERVVYVSCNPDTFATDAAELARLGFDFVSVRVFDMFPHTSHIESLGVFKRIE